MSAEAIDGQAEKCEEKLVLELRSAEKVLDRVSHQSIFLTSPPAFSIFSLATRLNA